MRSPNQNELFVLSHWAKLFGTVEYSPLEFYELVRAKLSPKELPDMWTGQVEWRETTFASDKRKYLAITYKDLTAYICAAPFGSGFFVSHRVTTPVDTVPWFIVVGIGVMVCLGAAYGVHQDVPFPNIKAFVYTGLICLGYIVVMAVLLRVINALTFFKIDSYHMFCQAVHTSVMEAIDDMTNQTGLAPLTEGERRSVLGDKLR